MKDKETETEIEEIIAQFKCPKDFKCYKSGFEVLCKAKSLADGSFLVCLEEHPQKCKFVAVDHAYLCKCPLRIYIAKQLKK
jgi:hypothetical protein